MVFKPKIINLKDRNADKVLVDIEGKFKTRKQSDINELEIIYLPLYGSVSGKTTSELLDTAIKLAPEVVKNDKRKRHKLLDLLVLLAGSFISDAELNKILEENMKILEDSPAVRVLVERGRRQGIEQGIEQDIEQGIEQSKKSIAINMLSDGDSHSRISRITGLDLERVEELCKEFQSCKNFGESFIV